MSDILGIEPIQGSRSAKRNKSGEVVYSASFVVTTANDTVSEVAVGSWVNNQFGDYYLGFPIQSLDCQESNEARQWIVSVTYGKTKQNLEADPRNEPAVLSVSYENHQIPIDFDVTGKPIVNTAGDPFADFTMTDQARPVLTWEKNLPDFPWTVANTYANKINRDTIFGAEPGTLKFEKPTAKQQYATVNGEDITYFSVSFTLSYDPEGWNNKPRLNEGYRELDDDGEKKDILIDGEKINTPVLLDEEGKKAEEGTPPHLLVFKRYRDIKFGDIFS